MNDEGREMAPVNDEGREMAPGRQVEARQWLGVRASAFGIDSSFGFRASPLARGGQGPGPFLAPACLGPESAGTPDARTIYYNYPTSGPSTMPFDGLRAVSMVERLGPP